MTRARVAIVFLLLAAIPPVLGAFAYSLADTRQLVPGLEGCRFVRDRGPQIDCYTRELESIVASDGLDAAFARIEAAAMKYPSAAGSCHLGFHSIGEPRGAAAARAGEGPQLLDRPDTVCQEGYQHGYMIGFLENTQMPPMRLGRLLEVQCSGDGTARDVLNCAHSFGHVIARTSGFSDTEGAAACAQPDYRAIAGDDPTRSAGDIRFQCLYGMYMEISLRDARRADPVHNNCVEAPAGAPQLACYSYLPARIGTLSGDMSLGSTACNRYAPEGRIRDRCVITWAQGMNRIDSCDEMPVAAEQRLCRSVIRSRA